MNAVAQLSAFESLQLIESRCKQRALGLPQKIELRKTWSGVGFRVGNTRLLLPLGEVNEI